MIYQALIPVYTRQRRFVEATACGMMSLGYWYDRGNDLEINVLKGKKLTNVRASGKDEAVLLTPPIRMSLEKALAYIGEDELVEVTPKSIRSTERLATQF